MNREEIEHLFVLKKYNENGIVDLNEIVKENDDSVIARVKHHSDGFVKDNWAKNKSENVYELTAWGKVIKKYLVTKDANEHKWRFFWYGVLASAITTILTGIIIPSVNSKLTPQEKYIEFPKMVLVHDTVIVRDTVWLKK